MMGIKCPKHVEHIISAINHSEASSWVSFSTHSRILLILKSYRQEALRTDDKAVRVHTMKAYEGLEVQPRSFSTSVLDGGERSTSSHSRFTPEKKRPLTTEQKAGWAPARYGYKSFAPADNPTNFRRSSDAHPSHYTH